MDPPLHQLRPDEDEVESKTVDVGQVWTGT